jgi:hypothetical protein
MNWMNKPFPSGSLGRGNGFSTLRDVSPRIEVDGPKPDEIGGAWGYDNWLIASSKVVATISAFDPAAIEVVEIDWIYADGKELDGYVFLDVMRLLYAYDYRRSVVNVEMGEFGKFIANIGAPAALKPDLPTGIHVFREAHWRHDIFFSRALAKALLQAEPKGFYFRDPARHGAARL